MGLLCEDLIREDLPGGIYIGAHLVMQVTGYQRTISPSRGFDRFKKAQIHMFERRSTDNQILILCMRALTENPNGKCSTGKRSIGKWHGRQESAAASESLPPSAIEGGARPKTGRA